MAAHREHTVVLAVTTSGRSSAILHSMQRPLGKGSHGAGPHPRRRRPTRHDLSVQDNGPDGWIQLANQ
jgi:hypothetical protein